MLFELKHFGCDRRQCCCLVFSQIRTRTDDNSGDQIHSAEVFIISAFTEGQVKISETDWLVMQNIVIRNLTI